MKNQNQFQNQNPSAPTFEAVWASIQETRRTLKEMFAETDRQMKETDKQVKETSREVNKTTQVVNKTSRTLNKLYAEAERERREHRKEMKELNKEIGGIANSNGDVAEAYFYNSFKKHKVFANEEYDDVKRNRVYAKDDEVEAEFDIILFNCKSVVIIEVKYNAKSDNISVRKIISRIEIFKLLYPEYKDHIIYLGVAALSFRKGVEQRLHRNGIATIRQIGKKMVRYDKEVKAF